MPDAGLGRASPQLHTLTAFPLGGQAAFLGLKAHQGASYWDYSLLPAAIPQVETEQKIQGYQRAAIFKPTTAPLKLITTQLHCLACCLSLKERGKGKQSYQSVYLKVLLPSLSSHTLHADAASGICQPWEKARRHSPRTTPPQILGFPAQSPSPHSLFFPFLLRKFKLVSFGNRRREKSKPSRISQAKPQGFPSAHGGQRFWQLRSVLGSGKCTRCSL